ncbi:leucyl aminopeptidase [Altererythrobacter sp. ZODW24]|uniref:leucyl aminopeptidase n=1 Tax=Altererythrobacter sp. ZODW24 TaxID=2185142 RepID=UPI000DF82984|nr:leucyl aminopeptidase [Altererythrobacter sp. ZODW24]
MQITFSDAVPADIRLVTRIAWKDADAGLPQHLAFGAKSSRFTGKVGQVFEYWSEGGSEGQRNALLGGGAKDAKTVAVNLEKAGAALTVKFLTSGEKALAIDLTDSGVTAAGAAALLMGARLRGWRMDQYRTTQKEEQKKTLTAITVVGAPAGTEAAWADSAAVAAGVEFTRELVTEPANVIYPASFVERCKKRLDGMGVEFVILEEKDMEELGMGALLGVGQGSRKDSKILAMRWKGETSATKPTAFVGKGVTFDTGGISIKPGAGMEDMKFDMGGAGAVAGTMLALAGRKAKADIVGVVGLVENMPDGDAQRPGDVVKSMDGQTIEVINTDAEGRLVLCDALCWTQKTYEPAAVVDLATLTGAIIISLGHEHAGCFSNDDDLSDKLIAAGKSTGDKLWRMPIGPAYDKLIDSPIADIRNVGPRGAGSITAAQFLHRFIKKGTPWAHLDIAGTVWTDKPGATWDKGASGFGVRVLDQYVRDVLEA